MPDSLSQPQERTCRAPAPPRGKMGTPCCELDKDPDSGSGIPKSARLHRDIKLPSPPAVAIRILGAVKNPGVALAELVRITSSDPALAAKVLRLANSAIYARSTKVETIKQAIAVLGNNALKNIALSFVILDGMRSSSALTFDFETFWRNSITAAVSTEIICQLLRKNYDDLFISGLLQDIGMVIFNLQYGERYLELLNTDDVIAQLNAERDIFGLDHQEMGCQVLREWGLPNNICDLVSNHHHTHDVPEELAPRLNILSLANTLSRVFHATDSSEELESFTKSLRAIYPASNEDIERIISSAHEKIKEILTFFEISPGNMRTCSQILQEANEELGKLNLTYEQMVVRLEQAKIKAETLARELTEANSKLHELVYKDALTGLFNHRYFQELLERELGRALRYARPVSLIMFDLDHFKKINDQYGHPIGDRVLKKVSDLALSNVRNCDCVARYGGEEFAVILPETDQKGSVVLAERLRKAIEQMELLVNGISVRATISVGIATYYPGKSTSTKSHLITAADQALYTSKNNGRNKTSLAPC